MPRKAATKRGDLKMRISADNLKALRPAAKEAVRTVTGQINFILDGWRTELRKGPKLQPRS